MSLERTMKRKLVIASHHKCATRFLRLYLEDLCARNTLTMFRSHDDRVLPEGNPDILFYSNAQYSWIKKHYDGTILHIIRNPLSIIASAYYSHRYSHLSLIHI